METLMLKRTNTRITATQLPKLREVVELEDFGKVQVLSIYHTEHDNFIVLKYLETVLESPPIFEHRFSVEPDPPEWVSHHLTESQST